jgi:hypothetical protein
MEMLKGILGTGSGFMTPTYENDLSAEGREPDYTGDHFGWDDARAIDHWNTQCIPAYVSAFKEITVSGPSKYQFLTYNCATMVFNVIRAARALDGEIILNAWLALKPVLSPPDVMRTSQYFAGHKDALIAL